MFPWTDFYINPGSLQNRYFAVRHGEAQSNQAGILSSIEANGRHYGLSSSGCRHIQAAVPELLAQLQDLPRPSPAQIVMLTSPLARAWESAEILLAAFKQSALSVTMTAAPELRDRGYGQLEGRPVTAWAELYQADLDNIFAAPHQAESVFSMYRRLRALFTHSEKQYHNSDIIWISHCDPIQVALSLFHQQPPRHYSCVAQPDYGAIRRLGGRL